MWPPLSDDLRAIIESNDLTRINARLSRFPAFSQEDLDRCLIFAILEASLDTIDSFIKWGANMTKEAFYTAISRGEPALIQLLLDNGWEINSTEFGPSLLQAAVKDETLLRWLLAHGADPNTVSSRRNGPGTQPSTPLIAAVRLSDSSSAEILLSHGADLDPLVIFAAIAGHTWTRGTATLELLIERGADINYSSKKWGSPLCHAVRWVKKDQLEVLLKHGADTAYRNILGLTAAEYAREIDQPELAAIIDAGSSTAVP